MPSSPFRLLLILGMAALAAPALADPAATPPAPATAAPAAAVAPLPPRMTVPEYQIGAPKAKVTMVEYASDTCPHCARFAGEVFPAFKKKYVDTGKVLYVFREFPTDPVPLSAAGFLLARCAGHDKYFDVLTALFKAQSTAKTGLEFLMAGAKVGGLTEDQMKACLSDMASAEDLNTRVQHAINVEKINGTPTFIINGKKLPDGEKTLKDLDAAITPLLAPGKPNSVKKGRKT